MEHSKNEIAIIGVSSCYGAQDLRCADAPHVFKKLHIQEKATNEFNTAKWLKNIYPDHAPQSNDDNVAVISNICKQLARQVKFALGNKQQFVILGGDHSCAIGTWSGAQQAISNKGELGLIWIDAHMDSHTPETSPSGAIHGMPVACLLGHGDKTLCHIEGEQAKLAPENLCLIGIRSYEAGEASLLEQLGVKVIYMDEVKAHGFSTAFNNAIHHISKNTSNFGVSLDLDAIDPIDAPGVGSPESNGISAREMLETLENYTFDPRFLGLEIAELNSSRDIDDKTAMLAINIIQATFK